MDPTGVPQRLENENGHRKFMERSWNMTNLPKAMEICDQSWNITNFASKFDQICTFVVTAKKLSSNLESLHSPTFSAKCRECKIRKRDGHGKSRNGHVKVMERYFVKCVGTLSQDISN